MYKEDELEIFDLMVKLGIDKNNDIHLAEVCFAMNLVKALTGGEGGLRRAMEVPKFKRLLELYQIDFLAAIEIIDDSMVNDFDRLFLIILRSGLLDIRNFCNHFSPMLVADWLVFYKLFPDEGKQTCMRSEVLVYIRKCALRYVSNGALLEVDPEELFHRYIEVEEVWINKLHLTCECFVAAWNAVFYMDMSEKKVKATGRVARAIKSYRKSYVPLTKLLSDVLDVKRDKRYLEKAVNPWAYVQRVKRLPVEMGVSVEETLFEKSAFFLKDEQPTDIIRAAFYPKSRNDSALECSLLLRWFPIKISEYQHVLIVNPSPDFILQWENDAGKKACITTYAVVDETVAALYKEEFPNRSFVPFSEVQILGKMDYILLICRDLPIETLKILLHVLDLAKNVRSHIFAILPNALFDSSKPFVEEMLAQTGCRIKDITILPPTITNSSPRKKVWVRFLKTDEKCFETDVTIFSSKATIRESVVRMTVLDEHCTINWKMFLNSSQTLLSAQKSALEVRKNSTELVMHRRSAERYDFSKEIKICYTIQSGRKGRYAGKAYYCAILRDDEANRQIGKRLTDIIEKGLRAKTVQEVLSSIEWVAFDERVTQHIVGDIQSFYAGAMDTLSLKTLWFCCRDMLLKKNNYDEELAKELFCSGDQQLAGLCPGVASASGYLDKMANLFGSEPAGVQLKYWRLLELIISIAVERGYLRYNQLSAIVHTFSAKATQEQQEVRNALVKKTFSIEEEEKILQFICAETKIQFGPRLAKRYEAESWCLAGGIRLFTGMAVRELCALTWSDFVQIESVKAYQLLITKFVSSNGTFDTQTKPGDWKKFRRIPLVPVLAEMLLERKRYLQLVCSCSEEALAEQPIILAKEISKNEKLGSGTVFCKPRIIAEKCKRIVAAADIPEQLLSLPDESNQKVTDISKYQGDLFQSNFKYRANHTCALRRGEINYILGIEPPDTFSRNYCDYTNDLVQYAMAQKLQRWVALHSVFSFPSAGPCAQKGFLKKKKKVVYEATVGGPLFVEIQLDLDEANAGGTLEIQTDCNFGCTGDVTLFSQGGALDGKP